MATKRDTGYEYLLELLPTGKENAINRVCLGNKLGLTARTTSQLIHDARKNGLLILSTRHGYFLPSNIDETREFYNLRRKQAVSLLAVLKTARHAIADAESAGGEDEE